MVKPSQRSRSQRRVFRKTPGANTTLQFKKRAPSKAKCGKCGGVLSGVPNKRPTARQNMPKSEKRPERPYGGALCSKCTRAKLKGSVRASNDK